MFEHFTFGAAPQTQPFDDAFPSPRDTSSPSIPPPPSFPFPSHPHELSDIIATLQQQTLQQRSRDELVRRFRTWRSEEALEIDDDEESAPLETASSPPSPTSSSSQSPSCRRLKRQLNVQLQSCDTHVRDIHALVADMIASNAQCRIVNQSSKPTYTPLSPRSSPSSRDEDMLVEPEFGDREVVQEEDEGFCEGEVDDEADMDMDMALRRASAPAGVRKLNVAYGRSRDVLCVGGRIKVRSLPRMRKSKVQVSRRES